MKKITFLFISLVFLSFSTNVIAWENNDVNISTENNTDISSSEQKTVTLKITGMTCSGCANSISTALDKVDGVIKEDIKYPGDVNTVTYDAKKTSEKEIIAAIEKIGYKASVIKDKDK